MTQDPADYFPPEILAKIFIESLPFKTAQNMQRNEALRTLQLVSPRWKELALHTPQLWEPLIFIIKQGDCRNTWLRVKQWVERAGGLPVTLFVLGPPHYDWADDVACNDCAVTLPEFEDFFKSRITTLFCAPRNLDMLAPIMSNTESLIVLPDYDYDDSYAFAQLKKHFGTLPRLHKLNFVFAIEDDVFRDLVSDTFSHGSKLTHLVLIFPNSESWAVVVANCKNLICGVFEFDYPNPAPSSPTGRQISKLESLRNLTLIFWEFATPAVFDYISCPNLISLRFKTERGYRDEDWRADAISHFSNQIRNISHFSFIRVVLSNFSCVLRSILQSCSASLEVLDIEHSSSDSSSTSCVRILQAFTMAQMAPYVLQFPLLRHLSITDAAIKISSEHLNGSHKALKRLIGNTPLMSDPEGTLRRRGVLNGVIIYIHSSLMYTHQQLADLRNRATEGEDLPVRFVMLMSSEEKNKCHTSWQYRIEEDRNQWYEGLYY